MTSYYSVSVSLTGSNDAELASPHCSKFMNLFVIRATCDANKGRTKKNAVSHSTLSIRVVCCGNYEISAVVEIGLFGLDCIHINMGSERAATQCYV